MTANDTVWKPAKKMPLEAVRTAYTVDNVRGAIKSDGTILKHRWIWVYILTQSKEAYNTFHAKRVYR